MTPLAVGFITFIVGAIFGYFANHFFASSSNKDKELLAQIDKGEQALSQYKQDVAKHLDQSANLLEQMNSTCQTAMQQMEQSTQLLKKASVIEPANMPFFSAETQQQLTETAAKRHPKREQEEPAKISQPPLDYSDQPSGLFVDQTQSVTNPDS